MGLLLPMQGTKDKPGLMFFLPKTSPSQLDELVRSQLEKQGVTKENDIHGIVEQAEKDDVDIIVMGSRGIGGYTGWILGSTSRRVVDSCTKPILIVK